MVHTKQELNETFKSVCEARNGGSDSWKEGLEDA